MIGVTVEGARSMPSHELTTKLVQIWRSLLQPHTSAAPNVHSKKTVLRSMEALLDGQEGLQIDRVEDMFQSSAVTSTYIRRLHIYWMLGEHVSRGQGL